MGSVKGGLELGLSSLTEIFKNTEVDIWDRYTYKYFAVYL